MSEYFRDPVIGWQSISYDSAGKKTTTAVYGGASATVEGLKRSSL
jgi:hypothetical protein